MTGPSFLDNGDFIIEVENQAGFERRVLNVQFQTEDEYNAKYFQRYLEHKENLKYHRYQPGETRWEDIVPEVKEFVFWEPPEEEEARKAGGKKHKKKKKKILKTIITPWGDEKEVEVTDEEGSLVSCETGEDDDEEEAAEEEEEEEEEAGWNVEGEGGESEEEEEVPPAAVAAVEEQPPPEEEPVKEPSPEKVPEPVEESVAPEPEPVQEVVEQEIVVPETAEQPADEITESPFEDGAYGEEPQFEEEYQQPEEEYEPWVRKEPEVEHPIILRRPKFYITDFQLRKKFYFVSKLIDVEIMKGKTLRMQSLSSSIGPVTCEWRHNGRLVKAPTARKSIEFYPIRNQAILEIENLRVQDSGTYTCIHYNDYTEPLIDSCKVIVTVPQPKETVTVPPTFTRLLTGINHYRLIKL